MAAHERPERRDRPLRASVPSVRTVPNGAVAPSGYEPYEPYDSYEPRPSEPRPTNGASGRITRCRACATGAMTTANHGPSTARARGGHAVRTRIPGSTTSD